MIGFIILKDHFSCGVESNYREARIEAEKIVRSFSELCRVRMICLRLGCERKVVRNMFRMLKGNKRTCEQI